MNIFARLYEPSTHAGIATLMQAAKFLFPQYVGVFDAATALFGSLAIALKEQGKS